MSTYQDALSDYVALMKEGLISKEDLLKIYSIYFDQRLEDEMANALVEKLKIYADNNLNALLIGAHGVGKSSMVQEISKDLNLKFKYYSASTLDPFADIVGVPAPDKEKGTLEFYRPKDLEEAEFIFFDELNRAHPRVLNAVLEIIQFKTVNGKRLPNLKMIWAAINPPGEGYQVEEMDSPLVDRFHVYIKVPSELHLDYLKTKMNPPIAEAIKSWWDVALDDHQRKVFTPRRVEYVGMMISKDLPWRDSIPQGHVFPLDELASKIRKIKVGNVDDIPVTKENILGNIPYFIEQSKKNPKLFILMQEVVSKFDDEETIKSIDLLEEFPQDLLNSFLGRKFPMRTNRIRETLKQRNYDLDKYKKVCKAFKWEA